MRNDCPECEQLFAEYREGTLAHLKVQSQLDVARASYDRSAVRRLELLVQVAADRREQLRQRFRDHERAAHALSAEAD